MALTTPEYVRSKISTLLSDSDIQDIIDETSSDVLSECETTDETNPNIILAGKYAILAATLRRMKTTGEAAATYETPGSKITNTTDVDIKFYQEKSNSHIEKYQKVMHSSFSSISFHEGFSSHCRGH